MASKRNAGNQLASLPRSRSSSLPTGLDDKTDDSPPRKQNFDTRLKRKAKRLTKTTQVETNAGFNVALSNTSYGGRHSKNSRRPRNGLGRGLPKKGGAGGKGTWGKLGSEMLMFDDDEYDSEQDFELLAISPEVVLDDLGRAIEPAILEYFDHGETEEVIFLHRQLNLGQVKPQIVSMIVSIAMERKPSICEMSSILLSDMFGPIFSQEDISSGFDLLLKSLEDIVLDTPDASTILGNFIARAVADDCLPPKFVQENKGTVECPHAKAAIEHADVLLGMKHGMVRLDNVWGVGGGMRPVKYLINQMQLLLKEFICSGDSSEACRCLQELEVPHFHHEIAYEAAIMVIEDMGERTMKLICDLLREFDQSVIVTPEQMTRGFYRVYEEMPDICIDVPQAYTVLDRFVNMCEDIGFLPYEVAKSVPSRGRKRFVSEGDGGAVKNSY